MQLVYERCAALDVHKKTVVACRVRVGPKGRRQIEVKTFGTTTVELLKLVDWLAEWECTHVAMESTGDYWKPIFNLLEGQVEVLLVNAKHVKHVPGRKTDVADAEWLAQLLQHGLLKASFIPPAPQRDLRDLTRYRSTLIAERARIVNRVQKTLEGANIKLSSVLTDTLGVSGRAMLEALVAGQTDAATMAELAKGRLRSKLPELEQALTGVVRAHHRFLLAQQLAHIDFLDEQVEAISDEIVQRLEAMSRPPATPAAPQPPSDPPDSQPASEQAPPTATEAVALLDTIPGINQTLAEVIVAELGTDMSRFPTAKHAAAWAGLAPGNNQSGGKRLSSRIRQGNRTLRSGLIQAAWAAARTKETYLAAQYRHLVGRRGKKRAIVAVAHSILVIAYHMLLRHEPYREAGGNYFDQRKKDSVVNRLTRRLENLGYSVRIEPIAKAA